MEVGAEGSTLAADYQVDDNAWEQRGVQVASEPVGAPQDGDFYGKNTSPIPSHELSGNRDNWKELRQGGVVEGGIRAKRQDDLNSLLQQVLGVAGVGNAPRDTVGASSRAESLEENEYTEMERIQERAEAALKIILEEEM